MEVGITNSTSSSITFEKVRSSFAALGVPEQLVTDTGPQSQVLSLVQMGWQRGLSKFS